MPNLRWLRHTGSLRQPVPPDKCESSGNTMGGWVAPVAVPTATGVTKSQEVAQHAAAIMRFEMESV